MSASFISRLESYGVLAVSGSEASKLLQGQLTCDVNEVVDGNVRLGACCTVQGRMIAVFYLTRLQDQYLLVLTRELLSTLQQQLNKFAPLYRGKAVISDVSDQLHCYGAFGEASLSGAAHPALPLSNQRFLYLQPATLAVTDPLQAEAAWLLEQIRCGEAWLTSKTSGELLPQQINLQWVKGISFSKGCYTGQEIIARMHYRGQLKRHMYLFDVGQQPLAVNAPVFASNQAERKIVGTVVNLQQYQTERLALIECLDQYQEQCSVVEGGDSLRLLPLPYAIEGVES